MKKILLATALLATLGTAWAGSAGGFGGATEITQWQNNALLGKQLTTQIDQYRQMVQSVQTQMQQLQALKASGQALTDSQWGDAISSMRQLNQVVQASQGISYSMQNADAQFQSRYPGYDDAMMKQMRAKGQVPQDFSARSEQMSNGVLNSVRGSMNAAGYQAQQFDSEDALLSKLKSQSGNAVGQMQAIQAGNQIAAFMVDELRKQRQLNMTMGDTQNNWIAYQVSEAAREKEATKANQAALVKNTNNMVIKSVQDAAAERRAAMKP